MTHHGAQHLCGGCPQVIDIPQCSGSAVLICGGCDGCLQAIDRRFIDFLMIEHMSKGGRHNGKLKAPDRQLRAFGIDARYVADAIREAEELGLVIASEAGCGWRRCTR
jgi:hypothetical protein